MDSAGRAQHLIDQYLNGLATADELRELNDLLEADVRAADALWIGAEIDASIEQYFRDEPRREEMRSTLERLGSQQRRTRLLPIAAGLLIALGGLAWWQFNRQADRKYEVVSGRVLVAGSPSAQIVEGASIVVSGESPAVIRLNDGSQAQFDPASEAIVHGRQGATRQVVELLHGSGEFHVEKGDRQFRVDTPVGSVTALGTEFSVDFVRSPHEGDEEMRSIRAGIAALAVTVATGIVQVDIKNQSFVLNSGESRVFAAEQAAGKGEKKVVPTLPSGDLLGFEMKGKSVPLEKVLPGITAALMLTDEQKLAIQKAQQETVQSESVRTAGATLKGDPQADAEKKDKAQEVISAARKELHKKVEGILTADQKSLVKQLSDVAADAQKTVNESFKKDSEPVKGDKAKTNEVQQKMREPLIAEFKSRAAKILKPEQIAAMDKAAEAQKAAEERAKTDPKKTKAQK